MFSNFNGLGTWHIFLIISITCTWNIIYIITFNPKAFIIIQRNFQICLWRRCFFLSLFSFCLFEFSFLFLFEFSFLACFFQLLFFLVFLYFFLLSSFFLISSAKSSSVMHLAWYSIFILVDFLLILGVELILAWNNVFIYLYYFCQIQ